jgi:hypothetical protein
MKPSIRAVGELTAVHGLLAWTYVALLAAFRPGSLALPVSELLPMRRDTFGAVSFLLSAVAAFAIQCGDCPTVRGRAPADAALRTIFVYPLLVWAYLDLNSITHPETIHHRLTHFSGWPTEGMTASCSFVLSASALFVLRWRAHRRSETICDG